MNNKLNSPGLAHIGIFVKDMEASRSFYTDLLGFKVDMDYTLKGEKDVPICFISSANMVLELIEDGSSYRDATGALPHHIAMACSNIEEVTARLKEAGVVFEEDEPSYLPDLGEKGCRFIMFRGPDGERLELNESY